MRKSLLLTTLLALVLLSATVVSAEPITVIGSLGYGSLSMKNQVTDDEEITFTLPGLTLQVGAVYRLAGNFGVGGLFDATSGSFETLYKEPGISVSESITMSLTGFNAIAYYALEGQGLDGGLFGGVGRYTLTMKSDGFYGSDETKMEPAFGFVGGAQLKAPVTTGLYLTGNAAFRTASFSKATTSGHPGTIDVKSTANAWSVGVGLGYEF